MASRELNMDDEADRLCTFDTWPNSHVQPRDLAACGFFYTKVCDIVKCFTCGVEIGGWQEGDDPVIKHDDGQSDCSFIQNYLLEKFPVPADLAICHHFPHNCPFHKKMHKRIVIKMKIVQKSLEMLKIYEIERPAHLKFATYESRLQTYKTWPKGLKMKPEKLCEAGFYYSGRNDATSCFHCGKDVCDWSRNDEPWMEHALFSPKCSYVLLNKGIDFVENIYKMRGCPKSKNDLKKLHLPDELKGIIEIRDNAEPSTSRLAIENGRIQDCTNQEPSGSEEPVRPANESAATENCSFEDTASSQPSGLKGAVCKKGCKGKGRKAKAKGYLRLHGNLNGSKNVDEKNDDTTVVKRSDIEESNAIPHEHFCTICCQEPLNIAILPCGHLLACVKCASSLEMCTVCFGKCLATVRIYLS